MPERHTGFVQYWSSTAGHPAHILEGSKDHCLVDKPFIRREHSVSVARIFEDARELPGGYIVQLRRDLHRQPKLGLDIAPYPEKVLEALSDLPLEITLGKGLTSVGAVLRGTAGDQSAVDRPAVLLRADMDALPSRRTSSRLRVRGAEPDARLRPRPAYGHAGRCRAALAERAQLAGDVVFMFQPAEEQLAGAPLMIEEGILELSGRQADAAYGLHVFSASRTPASLKPRRGHDVRRGRTLREGHRPGRPRLGAAPAKDPVPVMAGMILGLQHIVTASSTPTIP